MARRKPRRGGTDLRAIDREEAPLVCRKHGRLVWGEVMTTKCCALCNEEGVPHEDQMVFRSTPSA
jgi:hypothetical protein